MPKITPLGKNHYGYKCECGKDMELFIDDPEAAKPERVSKCWACLEKDGLIHDIKEAV